MAASILGSGAGDGTSSSAVSATSPCCVELLDEDVVLCGSRMNRLDNFKLRIRKGNASDAVRRGPMVARHPLMALPGMAEQSNSSEMTGKAAAPRRCCRTPPPIAGPGPGEGIHSRKRSPSIPRSRPSSPGNGSTRRPPSPGALDPSVMEAVKNRVRRVQQARLYLLQQIGPNSFLVGGDSPEHKYRVVIGPQTCSCGRGPHCLHLLFVMLRVFQVPESDSRIFAKELKNFEVESLFHNYQERRNSRVNATPDDTRKDVAQPYHGSYSRSTPQSESSSRCVADCIAAADAKPVEEELCPICLLEMVDGESLVVCITGCRNKLHHHCMAIWAEECYQQSETVLCPLCRHAWVSEGVASQSCEQDSKQRVSAHQHQVSLHTSDNVELPPHSSYKFTNKSHHKTQESQRVFLPTSETTTSPVTSFSSASSGYRSMSNGSSHGLQEALPYAGIIPPEQMAVANEWMKVFSSDMVSSLYSRDWKVREMALRRLIQDIIASHLSDSEEEQQKILWCCTKILTMVAADPVFKVYLGCVRCFRVLLSYADCRTKCQLDELKDLIRPIVRTLLLKCADRNRRTAHLSAEVLVELAKGQNGELALGRHVTENRSVEGLDGLELVLDCVLEDWSFDTVTWQWLAGRLIVLDHLIQDFPDEFWLQYVPLYPNESGYKLHNYNRLITVVEFAFKALRSPHSAVAKLARHVFVISSSMTARERGVFNQVLEMLSGLDPTLQTRLRKRLNQAATESGSQSQVVCQGSKKVKATRCATSEKSHVHQESQHGRVMLQDSPQQSPILKSLHLPTTTKSTKVMDTGCQTGGSDISLPRPKDLPLDLSKAKHKKPVKFQHLPGISPIQLSSRRWGNSGSKLLSIFTGRKLDELLPTKPQLNGIYRDICSPLGQDGESRQMSDCHRNVEPRTGFWSKVRTPTTPTAPHSTPLQEVREASHHVNEFLEDMSEELIIPIDLSDLGNQNECEIPSIPGLNSPLETDVSAIHPQDENMEDGMKCSSYLEGLDWKRGHLLGTGAFSSCYQARDVATGTLMAVKQMSQMWT
ncbi:mitogen-activated protein kinase kinase kinase 1-like isoform X2 [Periplaneta americana]|uniref:mitogen-activated protein kinase kinase kinase 1-like isoform X2 n=1 Tax=Periplaneta americana TaxID=6978 RepID=UPI0037E81821